MANVVIYSDGTGQRSGIAFDERRSNIYKLYRSTRCGPDSSVDPADQLTYYDPGLGTLPAGDDFGVVAALLRRFYNLVSQATGLGITRNIINCYASLVRLWQPGDRIFLFGFSRGAYTVRCLGGVIGLCGIPTQSSTGSELRRDPGSCRGIAKEAVKRVYQHTESRKRAKADARQIELLDQRLELARRFRLRFGSHEQNEAKPNVYPYFIGVFDTVASLANPAACVLFVLIGLASLAIPSALGAAFTSHFWFNLTRFFLAVAGAAVVVAAIAHTWGRVRFEFNLPREHKWRVFHFTAPRMKFYDTDLNPNVQFARHALAIDERRTSFQRVPWGSSADTDNTNSDWLEQLWFSGDHSDIGGSYPENESRLSDISLNWMLQAAAGAGLKYDPSVLKIYPNSLGAHHDETRKGVFRLFGKQWRIIPPDAPLHQSVMDRFQAQAVLNYDILSPYRPENLRQHKEVGRYY